MKFQMKKHLVSILCVTVFLFSCGGSGHDKEIGEIGKLRGLLQQSDSVLGKIDREEAERLGTEVRNNSQFIQFNINKVGDTLDFKTGLLLTDYRSLLKSFETAEETHKKLKSAVDSTRQNLENLEYDLKNNTLAQGLTPEGCVEQETEQVNAIFERSKEINSLLNNAKGSYDTLAPKIADYIKLLNVKLAEKQAQTPAK